MIVSTHDRNEDQDRRLRLKTQDARLARMAVEGAGLSPWESDVLVEMIQEVYFANPGDRPLGGGQLRYECVAAGTRTLPGRPCVSMCGTDKAARSSPSRSIASKARARNGSRCRNVALE